MRKLFANSFATEDGGMNHQNSSVLPAGQSAVNGHPAFEFGALGAHKWVLDQGMQKTDRPLVCHFCIHVNGDTKPEALLHATWMPGQATHSPCPDIVAHDSIAKATRTRSKQNALPKLFPPNAPAADLAARQRHARELWAGPLIASVGNAL